MASIVSTRTATIQQTANGDRGNVPAAMLETFKPFRCDKDAEITPELVAKFINQHKNWLRYYQYREDLYNGKHQIMYKAAKQEGKPDNKIVVNFPKYVTVVPNSYEFGIPAKVAIDGTTEEDKKRVAPVNDIIDQLRRRTDDNDTSSELGKLSGIFGHAYKLLYTDEDGQVDSAIFSPLEGFIVYGNTVKKEPLFAVWYGTNEDNQITGTVYTKDADIPISENFGTLSFGSDVQPASFPGFCPVIEYLNNEERHSAFHHVLTLIHEYNKAISEKANDVDAYADQYLKIIGADVDPEDITAMRDNRLINIREPKDQTDVDFLGKQESDGTQEHLLDRIERLIYQIAMVANINDEDFGNASGVSLAFKLYEMECIGKTKHSKFDKADMLQWRMIFSCQREGITKEQAALWPQINIKRTFNIPKNEKEEAETAKTLLSTVSKQTAIGTLSIVDNVDDELERIKAENESIIGLEGYDMTTGMGAADPGTGTSEVTATGEELSELSEAQTEEEIVQVLNGAQLRIVREYVAEVNAGTMSEDQAINMLVYLLGIGRTVAEKIIRKLEE